MNKKGDATMAIIITVLLLVVVAVGVLAYFSFSSDDSDSRNFGTGSDNDLDNMDDTDDLDNTENTNDDFVEDTVATPTANDEGVVQNTDELETCTDSVQCQVLCAGTNANGEFIFDESELSSTTQGVCTTNNDGCYLEIKEGESPSIVCF